MPNPLQRLRDLLFVATVCHPRRDSGNGCRLVGNAVRIYRPRVRTRSSGICFARRRATRKITGVGVLDPPVPPRKQPGPLTPIPASWLKRAIAVIILIGVAITAALLLSQH